MNPKCRASEELEELLAEDLASVRERESSTFNRIVADCGGRFALFGAGSLGRSALRLLLADGLRPVAISDNNPALWNTSIAGIPVLSPAEAVSRCGTGAAFFVTIWTCGHRYAETQAQLASLGCRFVYSAASIRWKYPADLLPFFLQDMPHKLREEACAVRAAFELWSDQRSCEEYVSQIRYRLWGDAGGLSAPDPEPSYFVDSLFHLIPTEVFIDCGAYDGDTIREFLERRGEAFSKICAFEPDPESYASLKRYAASLPRAAASRISAYNYAVASVRGQLQFDAGRDVSSAISAEGATVVEAAPLDELTQSMNPTFVKMDIEGAEMDALEGARTLISTKHPLLAICVYHRQSDLWRIPLLIQSMYPGYSHFLRAHEPDGWQTVGYFVPPERLEGQSAGRG